ncbi:unnamed protein product, partial [Timema podura]|nr:unnamed protein product [Timema podura]
MMSYETTGYNNHYQYLNIQQQTMPNGLGMGGQFNYFGLWLDAEFGIGHCSETCTTYKNCPMLSSNKNFETHHVEVWAVGSKPKVEEDDEMLTIAKSPRSWLCREVVCWGKKEHTKTRKSQRCFPIVTMQFPQR